jgi:hypothetical protein
LARATTIEINVQIAAPADDDVRLEHFRDAMRLLASIDGFGVS